MFVVASGLIGPRLIAHGLVGKDGFQVYGGAGKALLFSVVTLLLLIYRRGLNIKLKAWKRVQIFWFAAASVSIYGASAGLSQLIAGSAGVGWPLLVHLCILGSIVFAMLGSFGFGNAVVLYRGYKREVLTALFLAVAFYVFLYVVYESWQVLANTVLHAVAWLLGVSGLKAAVFPGQILVLSKFTIQVSKYCSGIDSIALFSGLYAVVGIIDWQRFNHRRYLGIFVPAVAVLFGCNILRVYGLILAGYYINPQIAFSLFHTYAGMVFFIIYSAIFWGVSYRWLTLTSPSKK